MNNQSSDESLQPYPYESGVFCAICNRELLFDPGKKRTDLELFVMMSKFIYWRDRHMAEIRAHNPALFHDNWIYHCAIHGLVHGLCDAESHLEKAKHPRLPETLYDDAHQSLKRGAYSDALALINEALQYQPSNPFFWNLKARALMELQRLEESLTAFDQAILLKPDYEVAQEYREKALRLQEQAVASTQG